MTPEVRAAKHDPASSSETLQQELALAREQQVATSNILRIISQSPSDVQPVFDAIVASAVRLLGAYSGAVTRIEGEQIRLAALTTVDEIVDASLRAAFPQELQSETPHVQVVRSCAPTNITDAQTDPSLAERSREIARARGYRSWIIVPLLHQGKAIGTISVTRIQAGGFSDGEINLLQTFASQAVIAVENTRLFEAEQASKRELQLSLEYQLAMSEVLSTISRSPADLQPVFQAIVGSSKSLLNAHTAVVTRVGVGQLRLAAFTSSNPEGDHELQQFFPLKLDSDDLAVRVVRQKKPCVIADMENDDGVPPSGTQLAERRGYRSFLAVPMLRDREVIGTINVTRATPGGFSAKQIELLRSFADQAVIAIENTRLFEEVQTRTRELQDSLEYQTATSDVLGVISRSKFDLQPVLDSIVETTTRLCMADMATIRRREGGMYVQLARYGLSPEFAEFSRRNSWHHAGRGSVVARVLERGKAVQIDDVLADPDYALGEAQRLGGYRTILGVPLLREGDQIGIVVLMRKAVQPFTEKQIELVETFADQAVIAIENVRLFEEVQARTKELTDSLEYQTAISDVLGVISRSKFDLQPVLNVVTENAARVCGAQDASLVRLFDGQFQPVAEYGTMPSSAAVPRQVWPVTRGTVTGRAYLDKRTVHVEDLAALVDSEFQDAKVFQSAIGHRTTLATPLMRDGVPLGVLLIRRTTVSPFTEDQIRLLETFADQAVIAIENTRLFEEVQARTQELSKTVEDLEIASQHKSQFVANMSHELRTPLAAILGYAELMQEGFYEAQGPKSLDALTRIRSNGKHLLGLINTVLDIAKIESGQFTLNMAEYDVLSIVETVRSATESLAQNKKLTLKTDVAKKLPLGLGDEQRLTQVLLNLVGNAIKFTDSGGVQVTASAATSHFTVSVADTGPGIPPDQLTRVFEQFHQVDSSNTKAKGGTGLGLAISKQIVEMHGGRIWVESTLGKGSVFHMELPTRAEFRKAAP